MRRLRPLSRLYAIVDRIKSLTELPGWVLWSAPIVISAALAALTWLLGWVQEFWQVLVVVALAAATAGSMIGVAAAVVVRLRMPRPPYSLPVTDLKRECLRISQEISRFLADRGRSAPEPKRTPRPGSSQQTVFRRWDEERQRNSQHQDETVRVYQERFGGTVFWLVSELKLHGHVDERLDGALWMVSHGSFHHLVEIVQRLETLARRLPDQ